MPTKSVRRPRIRRPIPAPKPAKSPKPDRASRIVDNAISLMIATYAPSLAIGFLGLIGSVICWIVFVFICVLLIIVF